MNEHSVSQSAAETAAGQASVVEEDALQIGAIEAGFGAGGPQPLSTLDPSFGEGGAAQVGVVETDETHLRAVKVSAPRVHAGQVREQDRGPA